MYMYIVHVCACTLKYIYVYLCACVCVCVNGCAHCTVYIVVTAHLEDIKMAQCGGADEAILVSQSLREKGVEGSLDMSNS